MALPGVMNPSRTRVTRACIFHAHDAHDVAVRKENKLVRLARSLNVTLTVNRCSNPCWHLEMSGLPESVDHLETWICYGYFSNSPSRWKFQYGVCLPIDSQSFHILHQQSGPVKDILSKTGTAVKQESSPVEAIYITGHFTHAIRSAIFQLMNSNVLPSFSLTDYMSMYSISYDEMEQLPKKPTQLKVVGRLQMQNICMTGSVNLQQATSEAQSSPVAAQQGQSHCNNSSFSTTGPRINQGNHAMDFGIVGNGQPQPGKQQTQVLQQTEQMQMQVKWQIQQQMQQQQQTQQQQQQQQQQLIQQQQYSGKYYFTHQQQFLLEQLSGAQQVQWHGQQDFVLRQHQAIPAEAKTTSAAVTNADTSITTERPTQRPLEDGEHKQPPIKRTRLSAFEDITGAAQPTTQTAVQPVVEQTAQPQQIPWPQLCQGPLNQYSGQQHMEGQQKQPLHQQNPGAQQPGSQLTQWSPLRDF